MAKTKLELTWIGKETRPKLEPRILLEDPSLSYHAPQRVTDNDHFDNRLIFGDNLLALKALEAEFSGKVKCIYIDPPFNTGEMFEHYDDGLEHSIWLSQMRDRISILHSLLRKDGTFCVHIDDNELGYLIAIADEVFGRANRCYIVTFKQSSVSGPKSVNPGLVSTSSYILIYSKDKAHWSPNKVYTATTRDSRYGKYILNIEEDYKKWELITLRKALAITEGLKDPKELSNLYPSNEELEERLEQLVLSDPGRVVRTARVSPKDISASCRVPLSQSSESRNIVFRGEREGKDDMYFLNGEQLIFYSSKARQIDGQWITGVPASTIWEDLLSNNLHKEGQVAFPNGKKPEGLIKRLLDMTTSKNDLVLDSFAGSGTTGAVAHKMKRKWILVELGDHCHTHVIPRLTRVIEGIDPSGVTEATGWKGGGGFRYFRLAPSLLEKDSFGNWIINKQYNPAMLAEAICKLEGFRYAPSDTHYWQHGQASESDFIYVTTQTLTREQLAHLSEQVGDNRSLLVMCAAFRVRNTEAFPNLNIKKIPHTVLTRCEWGKDDYSLEIKNLPAASPDRDADQLEALTKSLPKSKRKARKAMDSQASLFDKGDDE
jgi:adenine-specific DNA-methyltransferase